MQMMMIHSTTIFTPLADGAESTLVIIRNPAHALL